MVACVNVWVWVIGLLFKLSVLITVLPKVLGITFTKRIISLSNFEVKKNIISLPENVDVWKENFGFVKYGKSGIRRDLISSQCCLGKSPLLGKSVTVSVMGVPPYITFNPDTKVLGGIDVAFFKIIAEKFRLKVTMKPEKTWWPFHQLLYYDCSPKS